MTQPDDYVTLPPMRRKEVEAMLTWKAAMAKEGWQVTPVDAAAAFKLEAALEEPGEVRREYRVVQRRGEREIPRYLNSLGEPLDLEGCEGLADYMRSLGVSGVAVQHRTVTESPWRDLEEGERDAAD